MLWSWKWQVIFNLKCLFSLQNNNNDKNNNNKKPVLMFNLCMPACQKSSFFGISLSFFFLFYLFFRSVLVQLAECRRDRNEEATVFLCSCLSHASCIDTHKHIHNSLWQKCWIILEIHLRVSASRDVLACVVAGIINSVQFPFSKAKSIAFSLSYGHVLFVWHCSALSE